VDSYLVGLASALKGQAAKAHRRGTHRINAPEATLARVKPFARQMGITRLGNVTGLDRIGIPVAITVRPNSRLLSVSQGKGLTLAHAFASAFMESAEIFHGEDIAARGQLASHRDLSNRTRAVDPDTLCGTGLPLPASAIIRWIEGFDIANQRTCWIPWEVVHTDYTLSSEHSGEYFLSGTNGLASGNHILEALSSAICELIERDAVALWNSRGLVERAGCRLDLKSVDDIECQALLAAYAKANITPLIWDVTSDVGIAAFVCDIPADATDTPDALRRFRGSGCHPNRAVALARALTEAAQVRLTYIVGNRDDLPASDYRESREQRLGGALLDAASVSAPGRAFRDVPDFDSNELTSDVQWEVQRLQAAGLDQIIAVDLTRPDFGIPVARVVIPGLEWVCTHPQYTPGRRARAFMQDRQ